VISETARRIQPWYQDRGVQASTAFTVVVFAFNEFGTSRPSDHVSGLLAVSPMLAAVLVQRAWRVWLATALALIAFLVGSLTDGMAFDRAQTARLIAVLVSAIVGVVAAESRLKDVSRMLALGEVAKTAQSAIMRMTPPQAEGVDAAVRYVSASTEANIGGDAYEAVLTPFGLRVLVADARGKGIPAVLPSAVAVGAFREWAFVEEDLGELLCRMDASVGREVGDADFVTALVAEFRDDVLRYACAGHPRPILLRAGMARELPTQTVPPLSLFTPDAPPAVSGVRMQKDDVVLMFSDGLTDSRNVHGEFFGVPDALLRVAEHAVTVEECADGVLAELKDFVKGDLEDDVALVALRITKPVETLSGDSQAASPTTSSSGGSV
jgi:sigma-B regulation protein RsbU (phosphoserine phosphatase)